MNAPEKVSVTRLEELTGYVRDAVAMFRRRGHKSEHAMPQVADLLGSTPKRVKSLFYRDSVWGIVAAEADKIERRFAEHLDREIALSVQYTEELRAKKLQLTMKLERECEDVGMSRPGFGCGATG